MLSTEELAYSELLPSSPKKRMSDARDRLQALAATVSGEEGPVGVSVDTLLAIIDGVLAGLERHDMPRNEWTPGQVERLQRLDGRAVDLTQG